MNVKTGELLFVKCVKDGIPNRDPLRDSDARRIFGPDDGRISLSDVSIKRDVRDFVLARYPAGRADGRLGVFVHKEFTADGTVLLGRGGLAKALVDRYRAAQPPTEQAVTGPAAAAPPGRARRGRGAAGGDGGAPDTFERDLSAAAFDVRAFGVVFSVEGRAFNKVGPVQFGWAHSLHPVETRFVQGTVCMPSTETKVSELSGVEETAKTEVPDEEPTKGKTQGTIWTQYQLPFAVFAMPGVVSGPIAKAATMSPPDMDLLLESLWKGTLARQARGRGLQQPLLLLHVEYKDEFFRIGYLEEGLKLVPGRDKDGRDKWLGGAPPTGLGDVTLDVTELAKTLANNAKHIEQTRLWVDPRLRLAGELPAQAGAWPTSAGEAE
jgi:CRISPR-associated protein Csh2